MATAEFSKFAGILSAALSQHHLLGIEIAQLVFHPVAWENRLGISRNWATAHFLTFMVDLGTVMAAVSMWLSLLLCYNKSILRLNIQWKLASLPSWTYLVLIS